MGRKTTLSARIESGNVSKASMFTCASSSCESLSVVTVWTIEVIAYEYTGFQMLIKTKSWIKEWGKSMKMCEIKAIKTLLPSSCHRVWSTHPPQGSALALWQLPMPSSKFLPHVYSCRLTRELQWIYYSVAAPRSTEIETSWHCNVLAAVPSTTEQRNRPLSAGAPFSAKVNPSCSQQLLKSWWEQQEANPQ